MSHCDNIKGGEKNMIEQVVVGSIIGAAPVMMRMMTSLF